MKNTAIVTSSLLAFLISSAALIAIPSASAQVLVSDDFEAGPVGSDISGKRSAKGGALWSANYSSAILKFQGNVVPTNADLGELNARFWVNPKGRAVATLSTDLAAINSYQFDIGWLWFNGAGSLGVNARAVLPNDTCCYWFTRGMFEGRAQVQVSWRDAAGTLIPIGFLPVKPTLYNKGLGCTGLSIRVTGSTQQLYVNDEPFDAERRPVQAAPADKVRTRVQLTAEASPAASVDIRFDNIAVTQTPASR
ncbi:hypothetical protein Ga0100231_012095 [Opitutaceae bacterium TAV4]|nr:hypothetical protein Ga0100231_012095 [Opitutaceae bacterium TAV4]RRK02086.1 hypothetical protein Ga0100230_002450 [Opitutaceae bacterium TAV3]